MFNANHLFIWNHNEQQQFHSFKWLRIALNKLFSIKIEKVRVLTKYLDTIFKTIIGYQSTSIIIYEAFHSEQLNATLTTLVEKLFTTFFLYIALVFLVGNNKYYKNDHC